jgi:hypothetical protein
MPDAEDETTGVSETAELQESAGVEEDTYEAETEENEQDDESNEQDEANERTTGTMRLRPQARKEYNVFNTEGSTEEEIVMLSMGADNEMHEHEWDELDEVEAEYLLLTETLG